MPDILSIHDQFTDGSQASWWSTSYEDADVPRSETGGELTFTHQTSGTGWSAYRTAVDYDLTSRRTVVEFSNDGGGDRHSAQQSYFFVRADFSGPTHDGFGIQLEYTNLRLYEILDDVFYQRSTTTYNATDHRWWGLRESSGTIYWETSPNGVDWTEQYSKVLSEWGVTSLSVEIGSGQWDVPGTQFVIAFDNFNVPAIKAEETNIAQPLSYIRSTSENDTTYEIEPRRPFFADDFNDDSFDSTVWYTWLPGNGSVSETNQHLEITGPSDSSTWALVGSNSGYGGSLFVEPFSVEFHDVGKADTAGSNAAAGLELKWHINQSEEAKLRWAVSQGTTHFQWWDEGIIDQGIEWSDTYDPVAHRFFRWRSGNTSSIVPDDFNDNVLHSQWTPWGSGTVTETNQRLEIGPATTLGAVYATNKVNLQDALFRVEVVQAGNGGVDGTFIEFELPGGLDKLRISIDETVSNGNVAFWKRTTASGWEEVGAAVTYVPSTHRWLQIRESKGITYWETSSDGDNWTTHASEATPFDVSDGWLYLAATLADSGERSYLDNALFTPSLYSETSSDNVNWTTRHEMAIPFSLNHLTIQLWAATWAPSVTGHVVAFDNVQIPIVGLNPGIEIDEASKFGIIDVAQATETDVAQAVSAAKSISVSQPSEVDIAQTIASSRSYSLGQASEVDASLLLEVVSLLALATESDQALAITSGKNHPVAQTSESNVASSMWVLVGSVTSDLYSVIDEVIPDDADYALSSFCTEIPDVGKVVLHDVEDPLVSYGHILRYRFKKDQTGGDVIDFTIRLYDGDGVTEIASWTESSITDSWMTQERTLTTGQADTIVDYDNLQVWLEAVRTTDNSASRRVAVSWLHFEVPASSVWSERDIYVAGNILTDVATAIGITGVASTVTELTLKLRGKRGHGPKRPHKVPRGRLQRGWIRR